MGLYERVGLMVFLREHPEFAFMRWWYLGEPYRLNTARLMGWYRVVLP